MFTWTMDQELGRLPPEERAIVGAMVAYAGAFFRGAPDNELSPLRQAWRREFERRWPDRQIPDERVRHLPEGVVALR